MGKTKSQKRKEAKKQRRKKESARKIQELRNQNAGRVPLMDKKSEAEFKKNVSEIYTDIQGQIKNIDIIKHIAVDMYKLIDKIVSLRLDIPYLTDEHRERFKTFKEESTTITDKITELKDEMLKTAVKLNTPMDTLNANEQVQKYSDVIQISNDLLQTSASFMEIHEKFTDFAKRFFSTINECEKLRILQDATNIMPVVSPEEKNIFTKYLGNDITDGIIRVHEQMKEDAVKEIGVAATKDIEEITRTAEDQKTADELAGDIFSRIARTAMHIGNNEVIPEYLCTGATTTEGAVSNVSDLTNNTDATQAVETVADTVANAVTTTEPVSTIPIVPVTVEHAEEPVSTPIVPPDPAPIIDTQLDPNAPHEVTVIKSAFSNQQSQPVVTKNPATPESSQSTE